MAAIAAVADVTWNVDYSPSSYAEEACFRTNPKQFPDRDFLICPYRYVDTHSDCQNDKWRGLPVRLHVHKRRTPIEARRIGHIVDEIVDFAARFGTKLFMFFDDTFTVHRERAVELFEALIDKKRRGHSFRPRSFLRIYSRQLARCGSPPAHARGGVRTSLVLGIETGNSNLLRAMQKGTKLDDYRAAYKMIEEVGIAKRGSFIIGHPFETVETIRDLDRLRDRTRPRRNRRQHHDAVSRTTKRLGTPMTVEGSGSPTRSTIRSCAEPSG